MPTSGPRPLQLASGSIIPTRPTSSLQTKSDVSPSLATSPSSASPKSRSSSRRHSSISYIHSPSHASFRRESLDGFVKSPLSESHPIYSQLTCPGSRRKSLNAPLPSNLNDERASDRTSNASLGGNSKSVDTMKEGPPVTLADKHAELLHFIAQKESKCLQLRSQLATHEAELLQLKRKWELIVNRGFEKLHTSSSIQPSLSPSPPFLSPSAAPPPYPSSPYSPLLPGAHTHAPVLEGIKEGVQGMSRLIVAGFESIAGVPIDPPGAAGMSLHRPPQPLPPLLHSTSKRKPIKRNGQNESQSSSSSATVSTSTFPSGESAAAAATNTTTTSIRSSSFDGPASSTLINKNVEEEKHKGKDSLEEHAPVDEVHTTPRKRKQQGRALTGSPIKNRDLCLDDGGLHELPSNPPREQQQVLKPAQAASRNTSTVSEKSSKANMISRSSKSKPPPSLAPMSTNIPGLATMNLAGPAAQQVSSWMGTVGKKLGEIRGSSSFTNSQKRASLLLSDMQNTLVSSLISPTTTTTPATPLSSSFSSSSYPFSSSSSTSPTKPKLPNFACNTRPTSTATTTTSLLDHDDNDDELYGGESKTPVLMPTSTAASHARRRRPRQQQSCLVEMDEKEHAALSVASGGSSEFEDDWNW